MCYTQPCHSLCLDEPEPRLKTGPPITRRRVGPMARRIGVHVYLLSLCIHVCTAA